MFLVNSELKITKISLPLFSSLLFTQIVFVVSKIWEIAPNYLIYLFLISFLFDLVEQVRSKTEAPSLIHIVLIAITYVFSNLLLVHQKGLVFTRDNLLSVKGFVVENIALLIAIYWGITHGNMLSKVRAYWYLRLSETEEGRSQAFSPPSIIFVIRRVLLLGLVQHVFIWYFKLKVNLVLSFWLCTFFYIGYLQYWGLSVNFKSMDISIVSDLRRIWFRAIVGLMIVVVSLSLVFPENIVTLNTDSLSQVIVNLLAKVHNSQPKSEAEIDRNNVPIDNNLTLSEDILRETVFSEGRPNITGWLFVGIFLLNIIIVVLIPGLCIVVFLGWLLFNLVKKEYSRLEGLPKFFVQSFLWFIEIFSVKRRSKEYVLGVIQKENLKEVVKKPIQLQQWQKRNYFLKLVNLCSQHGLVYNNTLTPFEYKKKVCDKWPEICEEVMHITDHYVVEKYGKKSSNLVSKRTCEQSLISIGKFFMSKRGENASKKQEIPRL